MEYLAGLGNILTSEALPGSVPSDQYAPQKCPHNLYAEQLSGTAFTVPRAHNQRTWLYRLRPSVAGQRPFRKVDNRQFLNNFQNFQITPTQLRWKPFPFPEESVDFVEGISTIAGVGDPLMKSGFAIYMYGCNANMTNKAFYSSDGDLLIVPQEGKLHLKTEMGLMEVEPCEIVVVPRGIKFSVEVEGPSRGYIAEVFSGHFKIPDLGPIGSNGLADPRHFLAPKAWFEDLDAEFIVVNKFGGEIFEHTTDHSQFDVVGWHGNYYPYKYDLRKYNTIGSISFDHPDPSIFTVLTCQTLEPGVAVLDFVIFPPRWMVAEHTFRPPYYHRNCMTEFMGNIKGSYDAKGRGFLPGSASLHSCMSAHGPDGEAFTKGSSAELRPVRYPDESLQFMFESSYLVKLPAFALTEARLDLEYLDCWQGLRKLASS
jgi:homogentisate 1,2-dioxygenase